MSIYEDLDGFDFDPYESENSFVHRCTQHLVDNSGYDIDDARDECEIYYTYKQDKLAKNTTGLEVGFTDSDIESSFGGGLMSLRGELRRP